MLTTRFTKLVGCSVPIQQAGMGGLANPELAAAVTNAGGLRMVTTVYIDVFSYDWKNAPHRVLRSSAEAAQAFQGDIVGEVLDVDTGERYPIHRFQGGTIRKVTSGAIEAMPHWAGESVDGVKKLQPAAEIVGELAGEAEKLLRRWS